MEIGRSEFFPISQMPDKAGRLSGPRMKLIHVALSNSAHSDELIHEGRFNRLRFLSR